MFYYHGLSRGSQYTGSTTLDPLLAGLRLRSEPESIFGLDSSLTRVNDSRSVCMTMSLIHKAAYHLARACSTGCKT
eukprot:scaffold136675_cov28-Tisochrysis_lutea.AAC.1